jgi:hypothetical protein
VLSPYADASLGKQDPARVLLYGERRASSWGRLFGCHPGLAQGGHTWPTGPFQPALTSHPDAEGQRGKIAARVLRGP